jgi:acyl carrier protein
VKLIPPERVEAIIFAALNNVNDELPEDQRIVVTDATVLFGVDAEIDSLALVSIVVDVESALDREFGLDIALADEDAMDRPVPPFANVQTLKEYILERAEQP